jgi:Ca-activated chloride channel family protein
MSLLDAGHRCRRDSSHRRATRLRQLPRRRAQEGQRRGHGPEQQAARAAVPHDRPPGDHRALDQLKPRGGTGTGEAIQAALRILSSAPGDRGKRPPAAIVLISDGAATGKVDPVAAAQQARCLHIPIYTVALRTPQATISVPRPGGKGGTETRAVPPDPQSMAQIARASGGQAYTATDADRLRAVYEHLGSQLATRTISADHHARFTAGALALLALGAAISLRWFGRLI